MDQRKPLISSIFAAVMAVGGQPLSGRRSPPRYKVLSLSQAAEDQSPSLEIRERNEPTRRYAVPGGLEDQWTSISAVQTTSKYPRRDPDIPGRRRQKQHVRARR